MISLATAMKQIWQNLPIEIVYYHILPKCDIETRVALKIKPNKLKEEYKILQDCLSLPIKTKRIVTTEFRISKFKYLVSENICIFFSLSYCEYDGINPRQEWGCSLQDKLYIMRNDMQDYKEL